MEYSGIPIDVKRLIASFSDDRDILNYCLIDKHTNKNICNDAFFHYVLLKKYPNSLKYKDQIINRPITYKQYYLFLIHYIGLLKEKYGFDYSKYGTGNPKQQYEVFENLTDKTSWNELLIDSVVGRELTLVRFAIEHGKNIILQEYKDYALELSAASGQLDLVKYLLQQGADIHAEGEHPPYIATANNYLDVVKYLVQNGAN